MSGTSHLHSWNPPWAPSNLPFCHCKPPLLTLIMRLVVSSLLLAYDWNLLQVCDNFLHLENNSMSCIFVIYLYCLVLRFHVQRSQLLRCHNILQYLKKQLSHTINVHTFLVGPQRFAIMIIMIFSRSIYFSTLLSPIVHDNGILMYLL